MTDNFKAFLEEASKDKEFIERLKKTSTAEAVIALAAEKGFQLTAEDLTPDEIPEGELSDDDLDAVAGGSFSLPHGDRDDDRVPDRPIFTETPRRVDRFVRN